MLGLASCSLGEWHHVDFTDETLVKPGMFRVVKQQTTDMQELVQDAQMQAMCEEARTEYVHRKERCDTTA